MRTSAADERLLKSVGRRRLRLMERMGRVPSLLVYNFIFFCFSCDEQQQF
jgi:hypothetical protein